MIDRNLLDFLFCGLSLFGAILMDILAKLISQVQAVMKSKLFHVAVLFLMTYMTSMIVMHWGIPTVVAVYIPLL